VVALACQPIAKKETEMKLLRSMMAFSIVILPISATAQATDKAGPFFGEGIDYEALEDLETYVRSRYAWLNREIARVFSEGHGNPERPGTYLAKGWETPEHIALGILLDRLTASDYLEQTLLARGLPSEDLHFLERSASFPTLEALEQLELQSVAKRHDSVLDPFHESTDQEIGRFVHDYYLAESNLWASWTIDYLARFSLQGRRVLLSYLEDETVPRVSQTHQCWYRPDGPTIDRFRRLINGKRRMTLWAGEGVRPSALRESPEPPSIVRKEDWSSAFWVSADAIGIEKSGRFTFTEDKLSVDDVFSSRDAPVFVARLSGSEEKVGRKRDPCGEAANESLHTPSRSDPLRDRFSEITGAFVSEIVEITPGFYRGRPHSLLSLRVINWLREPENGKRGLYFALYDRTEFTVGETPFCSRGTAAYFVPRVGLRLVVLEQDVPKQMEHGILYPDPSLMFIEQSRGGFQPSPILRADPDLKEIRSFDALVDRIRKLSTAIPYEFRLVPGADL